jgi:hypothetical protein
MLRGRPLAPTGRTIASPDEGTIFRVYLWSGCMADRHPVVSEERAEVSDDRRQPAAGRGMWADARGSPAGAPPPLFGSKTTFIGITLEQSGNRTRPPGGGSTLVGIKARHYGNKPMSIGGRRTLTDIKMKTTATRATLTGNKSTLIGI